VLVDYPDKGPVSVAGIVTTLRLRTTKKGEHMAWIVISDGSAGLECAVLPSTTRSRVARRYCSKHHSRQLGTALPAI